MVSERFDRIEEHLDRLEGGHGHLQVGQAALERGQADLHTGQTDLRAAVTRLQSKQDELGRHMRVLHEDLIDRIEAIPTDCPTKAEMKREFAELREAIGRRLDPLEATVRRLSGG